VGSTSLDTDARTVDVDSYLAEMNAISGRTGPQPLFPDSPFAFPMIRRHITTDLASVFAGAVGDTNPLWSDEAYGAASCWGTPIGMPLLEACLSEFSSVPPPPHPEWVVMSTGGLRRYYEPFRPGDVIRGEDTWHGFTEKAVPGQTGPMLLGMGERRFINQHGRVVMALLSRGACLPVPSGPGGEAGGPGLSAAPRRYAPEELAAIRADYERELSGAARRGAQPRYWEDVQVGEPVPGNLKGPYDLSDSVSFAGAVGLNLAFAVNHRELSRKVPGAPLDPRTGAPRHPVETHFDDQLAQARGFARPPAFGTQLESVQLHAVTNWMSDEGFVTEADVRLVRPLLMGEASAVTGKVAGKRREGGRCLADLRMIAKTLDGVPYARGRVVVDLPSRDGYSPAARGTEN
jgi:acyl dehydratase